MNDNIHYFKIIKYLNKKVSNKLSLSTIAKDTPLSFKIGTNNSEINIKKIPVAITDLEKYLLWPSETRPKIPK
jgi:hypothetical protein